MEEIQIKIDFNSINNHQDLVFALAPFIYDKAEMPC